MDFLMLPVVVHSGHFHTDEVMAVAMLDLLGLLGYHLDGTKIIRTHDPNIIKACIGHAYILDVGQIDDPNNLQFDHHQKGFDRYFSDYALEKGVKMSSCGLLYKFLNTRVFSWYLDRFGDHFNASDMIAEPGILESWFDQFYNKYIMEIDANDNGVPQLSDMYKNSDDKDIFRYSRSWNLQGIITRFNTGGADDVQDAAFACAVSVCRDILDRALHHFITESIAKNQSMSKLQDIVKFSRGGKYMSIDNMGLLVMDEKFDYTSAAKELLYRTSELRDSSESVQWVLSVLPRDDEKNDPVNDQWQIHTVHIIGKSFQHRVSVLATDQAKDVIGDKLVFVHNARFIAITIGQEAAIRLAIASIKALERSSGCDSEDPEDPENVENLKNMEIHEKAREERLKLGVQVFALLGVVCGTWIGIIYYSK